MSRMHSLANMYRLAQDSPPSHSLDYTATALAAGAQCRKILPREAGCTSNTSPGQSSNFEKPELISIVPPHLNFLLRF